MMYTYQGSILNRYRNVFVLAQFLMSLNWNYKRATVANIGIILERILYTDIK